VLIVSNNPNDTQNSGITIATRINSVSVTKLLKATLSIAALNRTTYSITKAERIVKLG